MQSQPYDKSECKQILSLDSAAFCSYSWPRNFRNRNKWPRPVVVGDEPLAMCCLQAICR
jgi:hypothetical protein